MKYYAAIDTNVKDSVFSFFPNKSCLSFRSFTFSLSIPTEMDLF